MKKTTFILIVLAMVSCVVYTQDRKKFVVNDFSKVRLDTLIPIKNKSFYAYYIKVKGSVMIVSKLKATDMMI